MTLLSLGYIGVNSSKMDDWHGFATGLLGMQRIDAAGGVQAFRMDDRAQRLIIAPEEADGLGFMGWEVAGPVELDALAAKLETRGVRVTRGTRRLAEERHVADLIVFPDPAGNRLEAFYGAAIATDPFKPGRPISGFRTGPLGMGHVVLNVVDAAPLLTFYRDVLGFGVSDFAVKPYPLYFFHLNGRHHSFAMVGGGKASFHHFMVELGSLDDVGQGYDLAQQEAGRIAYTLGRHTNDYVTSFYAHSPSGFFVEYGWGGRIVDPATWTIEEMNDGPSLWGHERLNLDDGPRKRMRDLRMDAAARGVRANIDCKWFDSVMSQAR
jgi:2,3-dihydroxybiphenyl 1,2-dioxygenase